MNLSLVQLAESFGVAESVVEGWVRHEGLPHVRDRGRLLFDRAEVAEWAAGRGLAARAGFLLAPPPSLAPSSSLGTLLRAGGIWRDVAAADVLAVLARVAGALPGASEPVRRMLAQRLQAPGGVSLAPIGEGFALPHPSARVTLGHDAGVLALLLLRDPLDVGEARVDAVPVTRLLFFLAPTPRAHLELLGRLCRTLLRGPLRALLDRGAGDAELRAAFEFADAAAGAPGTSGAAAAGPR